MAYGILLFRNETNLPYIGQVHSVLNMPEFSVWSIPHKCQETVHLRMRHITGKKDFQSGMLSWRYFETVLKDAL